MKKLLLIPSTLAVSLSPLLCLAGCSKSSLSFLFTEKSDTTTDDEAYFYGYYQLTQDIPSEVVGQLCHLTNFKWGSMPYDPNNIYIDITVYGSEDPLMYPVKVKLTHTGDRFPTGEYTFDLVMVWYENNDYHHLFEQTITGFTIESQ